MRTATTSATRCSRSTPSPLRARGGSSRGRLAEVRGMMEDLIAEDRVIQVIPEPSLFLMAVGAAGMLGRGWLRRRRSETPARFASVRTRATRDAGGADTRDAHGPGAGAAVPSEANGAGRDGGQRGGVV